MTMPKSYATPDEPHAALVAERDRLASLLLAVRAEAQPALTYPDQGAQHVARAVMAATEGVCWASGLTIERCSDGVCDCGYEGWGRRTREAEAEAAQLRAELAARDAAIVALAVWYEAMDRGRADRQSKITLADTITFRQAAEKTRALIPSHDAPDTGAAQGSDVCEHCGCDLPCAWCADNDAPDTAAAEEDTCRTVQVDGQPVHLRGMGGEWDAKDQHYLEDVMRAAKRRYAAEQGEQA